MDYYTIPSLDDLVNLVADDGSCVVDNFCIGRYGYGNLYFDETMDVAGLNIDEIGTFYLKIIILEIIYFWKLCMFQRMFVY